MATYDASLTIYYRGELIGEAVASELLQATSDPAEQVRWATLLQLETETKVWLRPLLVARGLGIAEGAQARAMAEQMVAPMRGLGWRVQMESQFRLIGEDALPLYAGLVADAHARGRPDEIAVCEHMFAHENAQLEWVRRELEGADVAACVEPMARLLEHPLAWP